MRSSSFLPVALALIVWAPMPSALAEGSWADFGKDLLKRQIETRTGGTTATTATAPAAGLGQAEIGAGLKEALALAAGRVTDRLGRVDGFNADPLAHIALPDKLASLRGGLALAGQSGLLDDLEVRLNRAAEAATPEARRIFLDSLDRMTVDDARAILTGPKDAATQYFRASMTPDLITALRPQIEQSLGQAGAMQSLQSLTAAAAILPQLGSALSAGPSMLTDHVLDRALAAIFAGIGREEAAIRSDPAKRSTELLKSLFGGSRQ